MATSNKRWSSALAIIVIAVLSLLAFAPSPATAAGPTVVDGGVQDNFPDGMVFSVHAEGDTISKIRLLYKILPDGTSAIARPDLTAANSVDATVTIGGAQLYLPPGTVIQYQWEATDATGAVSTTEMQSFFYNDVRFPWKKVDGQGMTIYYYSGSDSDAADMHAVAEKAIADAEDLLNTTVPFEVQVWLYENQDDMRPALQRTSPGFESQIITEGVKVASNTVLVLGTSSSDTLRHELTHVVTGQAGDSPLGHLTTWLDEGTAVHGQLDPGGYKDAIDAGIADDNVLSVREITSYPGDASKIGIFYGEAWSIVSYLVDTYGKQKYAQLFADIKAGKGVDKSFQLVYGFDQDGLDNAWRFSKGLPARDTPAPTTTAPSSTTIPTLAPVTSTDSGGSSTTEIIAIALGVLLLAGVVGYGGIMFARRL
ncbi:MAG: peptidase MA family metallohydrolase [Chloroflexota bacterium]